MANNPDTPMWIPPKYREAPLPIEPYCECENPRHTDIVVTQGILLHMLCGGIVPCELCSYDDLVKPATEKHVDYLVCSKHLSDAVNNVADRRT